MKQKNVLSNDNLLKTKDTIYFETDGLIKPDNLSQGVVLRSSFYNLEYFSLCDNFSLDAMHDFSEGIYLYKLNKLLISKSIIHLTEVNNSILRN